MKKELLNKEPTVTKKNSDGSLYIPIGLVENKLDEVYGAGGWGVSDFKLDMSSDRNGNIMLVHGHALVMFKDELPMIGAHSLTVNPLDANTNYAATVLSYCIANAAKKKGIVFGRGLNGRLEVGETASVLPVIQLRNSAQSSDEIDRLFEDVKTKMKKAKTKQAAEKIMKEAGFSGLNPELKQILDTKK